MNRLGYIILTMLFMAAAYPGAGGEPEGLDALTDALLRRDPVAAAPHFEFPVVRPGPVPALTAENFAELFPEVFDDEFHAVFDPAARALGTNLWTEYLGVGTGAPPGLWCGQGGRVSRISYMPAAQRAVAASYGRSLWWTLAPALQPGVVALRLAFSTDDGNWRGRLDDMADGSVRVALWKKGRALSGMPDFMGRCVPSVPDAAGSACLWTLAAPDRAALFAGLRTPPANGDSGHGADEGAPADLYLRTKNGLECLSAHARGWWKLRSEQAAGETNVFRSEPVSEEERTALHSSLKRVPFENVLCFEADDGSFAGRIDFLTEARLEPAHDPEPPDDNLALFRIAVYEAPVRGWQEPAFVFYATQRMEGSGGTHSYVDITWRHSLGVDIMGEADGIQIAALELRCWGMSLPECDLLDWEVPMHLAKWADILRADPPAGTLPPWRRSELSFEQEIQQAGSEP